MLSPLLQKLLFVNQFGIADGKIEILGGRYIMLNASDILDLQEIDSSKMYALMKGFSEGNIKAIIEHARVYKELKNESIKNIANLSKKMGDTNEGIKTLQELFNLYGLGKLEITDLDNKNRTAVLEVIDSTIAKEYLEKNKKSKTPVCAATAGILAGIFSFIFKKDVDCIEKDCRAKGDEVCLFRVE